MAAEAKAVRGSKTGRPIMVLLDLFGRRWALRIIWEMRDGGHMTSRQLRAACDDISPNVLHARLKEMREAGFVVLERPHGYRLTALGQQLQGLFLTLYLFAEHWAAQPRDTEPSGSNPRVAVADLRR